MSGKQTTQIKLMNRQKILRFNNYMIDIYGSKGIMASWCCWWYFRKNYFKNLITSLKYELINWRKISIFNILKIVEKLKVWMDENFEPNWHVFSGTNFGSLVTHEKRHYIFFYIEKVAFLCYKMGWNIIIKLNSYKNI